MELVPHKTARKKKAVVVHLHGDVKAVIKALPRGGEYLFPDAVGKYGNSLFQKEFGTLLDELKITDDDSGKVGFHSLRKAFVTECEERGISRQVVQGVVGHGSAQMTAYYSHDKKSGAVITTLPSIMES
jgi:integrase